MVGVPKITGILNLIVKLIRDFEAEKDRKILLYCTGGIRCEKTSAWMKNLGMDVFQLEGGILNYFLQMPDAEDSAAEVLDRMLARIPATIRTRILH